MNVSDLPVSPAVKDSVRSDDIERLYPPQAEAVDAGVTQGENVVAAIPTAAGKTLIAELAMLTASGPGLYIVPLRALAREKYEHFKSLPNVSAGITTSDVEPEATAVNQADIIVATAEKVDAAIRNGAAWIERLACVVIDEVHLVGSKSRGPTLEVTVATLQQRAPGLQIVALSATIANPEAIANWLNATLVSSTWRPVSLRTGLYNPADDAVLFDDGNRLSVDTGSLDDKTSTDFDPDLDTIITRELIKQATASGGQCLAFVRSRQQAEALAEHLLSESFDSCPELRASIMNSGSSAVSRQLAACAETGVAFHHAGLRNSHRELVEKAFRDRTLRVICATPTLAAGVNVPARRVVIRDLERFSGDSMEALPVMEVHQMCGRAGRPHLDPYGEAVLIGDIDTDHLNTTESSVMDARDFETDRYALWQRYIEAGPEAVHSQLPAEDSLQTHVLAIIASGFAASTTEVIQVLTGTFFAHESGTQRLHSHVESAISDLISMSLIESGDGSISATQIGRTVSKQYLTPTTGAQLRRGIKTMQEMSASNVTSLTALELICSTPDMYTTYLGNKERATTYRFAMRNASQFTTTVEDASPFEAWLSSVKIVRIVAELLDGTEISALTSDFQVGPGDIETYLERTTWLCGATDAIMRTMSLETEIAVFDRIHQSLFERMETESPLIDEQD